MTRADLFGTSGIRGVVGEEITAELALRLGRALAGGTDSVVVGRDTRQSGAFLADALSSGLREGGTDVGRLGVVASPTVIRSVDWYGADLGIAVTASHNPPAHNGFKIWRAGGRPPDESLRETISARVDDGEFDARPGEPVGTGDRHDDARDRHVGALVEGRDPLDLSVVVDVGNGTGGVTVDALARLGCTVRTLNAQEDGRFPGRPSEPSAENCRLLQDAVGESDADLGVAHDGDADRMMAVTEDGDWIPGDVLLACFAREAATDGDAVAAPINTSHTVDRALEDVGASLVRTPIGDVAVGERAREPGVVFGGEPSGVWIWPDEGGFPDGPLAAVKLAGMVARHGSLSSIVGAIDTTGYRMLEENVGTDRKHAAMEGIRRDVRDEYGDVCTLDGVYVDLGDAWFLIRPSGTEAYIRVRAEAEDPERTEDVFERACGIVQRNASS